MNIENLKNIDLKQDDKAINHMLEKIKINYAIMLLLKFGKSDLN